MKLLLLVALIACAYAEPEADAYFSRYYNGYSGYYPAYSSYGHGYGYPSYGYRSYGYNNYRLYKRDADAEPEAYYNSYYAPRSYAYGSYGLRSYGYNYAPYSYGYASPAYGYGSYGYRLHKREAEAEPEADAYYNRYYAPTAQTYGRNYNGLNSYSFALAPYSYGYASPAYGYGSYGYRLHKREAEAEPEAAYYGRYYNAYPYSYGYRSYASYPYSYGYPGAYTYGSRYYHY